MTKGEYIKLIKELAPNWKHPTTFKNRKEAIDFYYDIHQINGFVQDIKTKKIIKLDKIGFVKDYTVNEIKTHRSVNQIIKKEYEMQKKLDDIQKDF